MKRIVALIFAVLVLVSCGGKSEAKPIESADYTVTFKTDEFDENGCHVLLSYPTVEDTANDAELNELLYGYVYSHYKNKCLVSDDGTSLDYKTVNCAVTYSIKGFFSALIFVEYYSSESSHSMREGFSINCATDECRIYTASELIKDYDGIKKQFTKGKFEEQYGMTNITAVISLDELISQYLPEYDIYPEIYFEDGRFGMNLDVVHLYGGYVGFITDISNVKRYLNHDIGFVASICGE